MLEVKCVKIDDFFKILESVNAIDESEKNKRYALEQFTKFAEIDNNHLCYYVEFDDGRPVAACVGHVNYPEHGYMYINELQSFISGHEYGKKLLRWLNMMNQRLWLCRSMEAPELDKYYDSFGWLKSIKIDLHKNATGIDHTYLYHKNCDEKLLKSVWCQ